MYTVYHVTTKMYRSLCSSISPKNERFFFFHKKIAKFYIKLYKFYILFAATSLTTYATVLFECVTSLRLSLAESLPTSTAEHSSAADSAGDQQSDPQIQQSAQQWPAVLELQAYNVAHSAVIQPYHFWNTEFRNKQPAFIRLNLTLPWGANFAVYGRRNVAPSVTQYDFVEFVKGGRVVHRLKRDITAEAVSFMQSSPQDVRAERAAQPAASYQHVLIKRTIVEPLMVNVSLLQYFDTGDWFLSVYNDELQPYKVTLVVTEAEGVSTTCPNDCSGRGSCYLGKCDCIDGYQVRFCAIILKLSDRVPAEESKED